MYNGEDTSCPGSAARAQSAADRNNNASNSMNSTSNTGRDLRCWLPIIKQVRSEESEVSVVAAK